MFGSPYGNCGFFGGGGLSGITCDCLPRTESRGGLLDGVGSALGGNSPAPTIGPSFGATGGAGRASILRLLDTVELEACPVEDSVADLVA